MPIPLKLAIEGMHCNGCVARVTNALSRIEGVEVRKVDVGTAEVIYDETKLAAKAVAEAVNRIGFTAKEV